MVLGLTIPTTQQAQNAYETEIKLLKLKLAAQIAANKALDERIKKIKQNHMEHVEMIVEERLQRRLMEKREKMSEVSFSRSPLRLPSLTLLSAHCRL